MRSSANIEKGKENNSRQLKKKRANKAVVEDVEENSMEVEEEQNNPKQPRRRSARLIAISKPEERRSKYKESGDEKEEEDVDQFGSLENLASAQSNIQLEEGEEDTDSDYDDDDDNSAGRKKKRKQVGRKALTTRKVVRMIGRKEEALIAFPSLKNLDKAEEKDSSTYAEPTSSFSSAPSPMLFTFASSSSQAANQIDLSSTPISTSNALFQRHNLAAKSGKAQSKGGGGDKVVSNDASDSSEDGDEEWEALEPVHSGHKLQNKDKLQNKEAVQVHLEGEAAEKFKSELNPLEARNAKEEEERAKWENLMRLDIERKRKELQEDFHRIHFLAHIAHLRFLVSAMANNRQALVERMGSLLGFSTFPATSAQMGRLLREVFRPNFSPQNDRFPAKSPLKWCKEERGVTSHLLGLIQQKGFNTDREVALLFFVYSAFLLELPTRLCLAFNPMSRLVKLPKYLAEKKPLKKRKSPKGEEGKKAKSVIGKMREEMEMRARRMPTRSAKRGQQQQLLAQKRHNEEQSDGSEESSFEDEEGKEEESAEEESEEEEEELKAKKRRKSMAKGAGKRKKKDEDKEGEEDEAKIDEEEKQPGDEQLEPAGSNASRVYWNEYWDESERRWITVDAFHGTVDVPAKIEQKMDIKLLYVLAVDNDQGVREIAAKYASDFLALETRRLRTEPDWLEGRLALPSLKPANEARARAEDGAILDLLKSKPLPMKLGEYKNHPLYALRRDLLKFEAIYPPDTAPVGRVGSHDVFPRSAVHKLEGTLNWIKESRSIKTGEQPYKVVKARPKTNIPKEKRTPLTLDLFGFWQTEPYVPPEVVDGRIPRNEFGNLYMYKPEMLPKGCVHLRLPGIFNVARRFDLEAVPAVVGWEFSGGLNHPILDGCVVLKKDEEVLRTEWHEMSRNKAANEAKKSTDRVWKNWRRLIRSKLLLEKMRARFK